MPHTPTDALEKLSDAELNEIFAVEVAALENIHWIDHVRVYGGEYPNVSSVPNFCSSADAVLPFLEKFDWVDISREHEDLPNQWTVAISKQRDRGQLYHAAHRLLSRAAALALIKAKRAEKDAAYWERGE